MGPEFLGTIGNPDLYSDIAELRVTFTTGGRQPDPQLGRTWFLAAQASIAAGDRRAGESELATVWTVSRGHPQCLSDQQPAQVLPLDQPISGIDKLIQKGSREQIPSLFFLAGKTTATFPINVSELVSIATASASVEFRARMTDIPSEKRLPF